tara:strand:- start:15831 stop:17087 length:1257 start_codon:yes stop_codon:yes gene_type:complete
MRVIAKEQHAFLLEMERTLGPVFWINMGFGIWSIVVTGEEAHTIMKNKATRSDLLDKQVPHITGHTLLVNDGTEHRRMRGAMNGPFTPKGINAADIGKMIYDVVEEHFESWEDDASLDIHHITNVFALDVIFRILGIEGADLPLWRKKFSEFIGPGMLLPFEFPGSPKWKSKKAQEWMDERFSVLVKQAREKSDTQSMLGALAHGADERGRRLEDKELLANLRILALAGHETTASVLAWVMLHLSHSPKHWDLLLEEVRQSPNEPITPKTMASYPLAEAVFRECLRLYPPVSLLPPRRVAEEMEIYGHTIPVNTRVVASLISLSKDAAAYPDPLSFQPERWLGREKRPGPLESVQFGGGPHFCLGYHLALLEGVQFIVSATRYLDKHNLRPTLQGDLPTPKYLPLTRPPKTHIELHAA